MITGMPARLALPTAGTISFEPDGQMHSTATRVSIRFSMICICRSTSISRSAACMMRSMPARAAAASAPLRMSRKNGLLNVLSTSATRGRPPRVRLQAARTDASVRSASRRVIDCVGASDTETSQEVAVAPGAFGRRAHAGQHILLDDDPVVVAMLAELAQDGGKVHRAAPQLAEDPLAH